MTQHQIGFDVSRECNQETLLNHLQSAFKIDNETHESVLEKTRNLEVIILNLFWIVRNNITSHYLSLNIYQTFCLHY